MRRHFFTALRRHASVPALVFFGLGPLACSGSDESAASGSGGAGAGAGGFDGSVDPVSSSGAANGGSGQDVSQGCPVYDGPVGPGPESDHAFTGTEVIVAAGYGGRRVRSLDLGQTWQDMVEDAEKGGDDKNLLRAITYAQHLFVAVGWRIHTSSDGQNWTERTLEGQQWMGGVAYGNGRFVAIGGCGKSLVSEDGVVWEDGGDGSPGECGHLRSLAFGNGRFVALGNGGRVITSTDGSEWTQQPSQDDVKDVVYRDGEFRANCSKKGCDFHRVSKDGVCWEKRQGVANNHAYGHGVYLRGGKTIEISSDGENWEQTYDGTGTNSIQGYAFGGTNDR